MRIIILVFVNLIFLQCYVIAQVADRLIVNPLAVGGMVQGLLDLQIRPEGGYYQDRYKNIFTDHVNVPVAIDDFDRRNSLSNSKRATDILTEDGKLLAESASGMRPNPCFDAERIVRNRLLLLMCSLQLVKEHPPNNVH